MSGGNINNTEGERSVADSQEIDSDNPQVPQMNTVIIVPSQKEGVPSQKRKQKDGSLVRKRKKKDRKYHNVPMQKLSESFERQFFAPLIDLDNNQAVQDDISPTLYEKYEVYKELKKAMTDNIRYLMLVSVLLLLVGAGYFIAEMISMFDPDYQPLTVQLALLTQNSRQQLADYQLRSKFSQTILVIVSVGLWVMYLTLGVIGLYTRSAAKIKTMNFTQKMGFWAAIMVSVLLAVQLILGIIYLAGLETCKNGYECRNVGKAVMLPYVLIQLAFSLPEVCLFFGLSLIAKRCSLRMLTFHDYLVSFKQTPRSRIFKRYRPPLEVVPEIDSQYERSEVASVSASQRMSQISKMSMVTERTAKKFKYKDDPMLRQSRRFTPASAHLNNEDPDNDSDSGDSSDSSNDSAHGMASGANFLVCTSDQSLQNVSQNDENSFVNDVGGGYMPRKNSLSPPSPHKLGHSQSDNKTDSRVDLQLEKMHLTQRIASDVLN